MRPAASRSASTSVTATRSRAHLITYEIGSEYFHTKTGLKYFHTKGGLKYLGIEIVYTSWSLSTHDGICVVI